jgi:AmmeMemoRadiSam system protein B
MRRSPAVSGSFYPDRKEDLIRMLEWAFKRAGFKGIPKGVSGNRKIKGIISPHAGYVYSGPTAAAGYYELSKDGKPEIFFIIGPNHTGIGGRASIPLYEEWETPLGLVSVDLDISRRLSKEVSGIRLENSPHTMEHSVEVQLPFIQAIFGDIKIVPMIVLDQDEGFSRSIGNAIWRIVKENSIDAIVIASSDMTHYEPDDIARKKDEIALRRIVEMDSEGLFNAIYEHGISMCGPSPVAIAIEFSKLCGVKKGELVRYMTSGEMTGERGSVVGYASVIFRAE